MDDRVKIENGKYGEYIAAACGSEFEGCFCTRPKAHTGLHRCGNAKGECPRWDDAQAATWWEEFKATLEQCPPDLLNELEQE